jgi:predicted HicB family RNase H-like nuclease
MATMQYGDYVARIMLDERRGVLHGRVENLADVISFEGATVEELQNEFEESVKLYLKVCKKKGIEPKRPYSGKFVVRLNPTLHREIAVVAERHGESINKWVERALEQAALG